MVLAVFELDGKIDIVFVDGRPKDADYQIIIEIFLVDIGAEIGCPFRFLAEHNTNSISGCFFKNEYTLWDGPDMSPDMNPIENLWRMLSRTVYANCRQYVDMITAKKQF